MLWSAEASCGVTAVVRYFGPYESLESASVRSCGVLAGPR
jgi:hypothetical protein